MLRGNLLPDVYSKGIYGTRVCFDCFLCFTLFLMIVLQRFLLPTDANYRSQGFKNLLLCLMTLLQLILIDFALTLIGPVYEYL